MHMRRSRLYIILHINDFNKYETENKRTNEKSEDELHYHGSAQLDKNELFFIQ